MAENSNYRDATNEDTVNAAAEDLAALVRRWQTLPTAGAIDLHLEMDEKGFLKPRYRLNGQWCSAEHRGNR